jgi:protein-S-isoprenylcysteine O-methyltransferase Ste14
MESPRTMRLIAYLEQQGAVFFRHRGSLPTLVLLPVLLAALADARYLRGGFRPDLVWEVGCFLIAAAGLAIRVAVSGTSPEGTSGRNTAQRADSLNTTGLYSVVRHPLYVGNLLMGLGIALQPRVWYVPVIFALVFALYYERLILVEEMFLERKFGAAFGAWADAVPAFIPRWRSYVPAALPFSWRAALRREYYGLCFAIAVFAVLDFLEDWMHDQTFRLDPVWTTSAAIALLAFVILRYLKKRTRLLQRPQ